MNHITYGYYHVMEERSDSFLTQQVSNQYIALIEVLNSNLVKRFSERFFYAFYHSVVGTYEHVLTE